MSEARERPKKLKVTNVNRDYYSVKGANWMHDEHTKWLKEKVGKIEILIKKHMKKKIFYNEQGKEITVNLGFYATDLANAIALELGLEGE